MDANSRIRCNRHPTAKPGRIAAFVASAFCVLLVSASAHAQAVRDTSPAGSELAVRPRTARHRPASEMQAAPIRIARQQVEAVPEEVERGLPLRAMESLDLRVPTLAELSTAEESERIEIPDDASDVIGVGPPLTITVGGQRAWSSVSFTWEAPALCHRPLYFEDVNLERHGHSFGVVQPAVSAGRAFGQLLALPYQMTVHPPCECIYTLGEQRPGNCVPYQLEIPPVSLPAGAAEAGVVAGLILLIP